MPGGGGKGMRQVGDGHPQPLAPHSPPLGPGTIQAHRRGRAPARWRGRPWSPPEIPAASASRPHSAKHSCYCTAPLVSPPAPQHIHTIPHILPTPPPQPRFPHQATHACHGGDNAASETLKWIQGSWRDVGVPQRCWQQLRPCVGGGRRHLQEPRCSKGTHSTS